MLRKLNTVTVSDHEQHQTFYTVFISPLHYSCPWQSSHVHFSWNWTFNRQQESFCKIMQKTTSQMRGVLTKQRCIK